MTSMTSKNLENSVVNIVLYSIVRVRVMVMVFSATYSNISFISRFQFYLWRKQEYPEKTTDLSQVTDKFII
jgi:hypothetical protein